MQVVDVIHMSANGFTPVKWSTGGSNAPRKAVICFHEGKDKDC